VDREDALQLPGQGSSLLGASAIFYAATSLRSHT
jgi:hypothetical protein